MATGIYYLLREAGSIQGAGPYVGFDSTAGFKQAMMADRLDAKRYFDRGEAEADSVNLSSQFGPLEIEERIGVIA